jgi:hypothetical protein
MKSSVCSIQTYQKGTKNYFFPVLFLGENVILGRQRLSLFDIFPEVSNYFFFKRDETNRIQRYLNKGRKIDVSEMFQRCFSYARLLCGIIAERANNNRMRAHVQILVGSYSKMLVSKVV